jgi:hypothetical protein
VCAAKTPKPRYAWLSFLCGCVLALIFMELAMHNFAGKTEGSAGFEERGYREGHAKSHFSADGLRLTGNPQIAGAPTLMVLGDSHVEAFSVWDHQTMGSILERRLRADGKQWNVVQYGWSGADGPDYVWEAALLQEKFQPKTIFLITTYGDYGSTVTEDARLVERDGKVVGEPAHPGALPGRPISFGGKTSKKLKESGLLYASAVRFNLEVLPLLNGQKKKDDADAAAKEVVSQETVDLIVRGLRDGYGEKLRVLYVPRQPFSDDMPEAPQESAMLAACAKYGVACRSLRERMIHDLMVGHVIDRGFSNTGPGVGHLNVRGHELVADELYDWLNASH